MMEGKRRAERILSDLGSLFLQGRKKKTPSPERKREEEGSRPLPRKRTQGNARLLSLYDIVAG